jgi:plastocyanin
MKRRVALLLSATTALIGALGAVALAQGGPVDATSSNTFSPAAVTLTAGQTITITNAGTGPHNLLLAGSTLENSGTNWNYTSGPLAAGTYIYYCTLHGGTPTGAGMHVTVTVNPATTPAPGTPSPGTPAPGTPAPGTPSPTTPAVDSVAPKISRVTTSRTLKRAIVRFRLDEAATVTARLRKRGSTRTLKRVTRELDAGNGRVTLRRNLTAGGRYQVALRIVDGAGNVTTRTVSFTAPRS